MDVFLWLALLRRREFLRHAVLTALTFRRKTCWQKNRDDKKRTNHYRMFLKRLVDWLLKVRLEMINHATQNFGSRQSPNLWKKQLEKKSRFPGFHAHASSEAGVTTKSGIRRGFPSLRALRHNYLISTQSSDNTDKTGIKFSEFSERYRVCNPYGLLHCEVTRSVASGGPYFKFSQM